MNKKIASEISFGIIIFIAVIIGASIWIANEKTEKIEPENLPPFSSQPSTNQNTKQQNLTNQNTQDSQEKRWPDYINKELGISLNLFSDPGDHYLTEEDGKIYLYFRSNTQNKDIRWEQDVLEIYPKDEKDSFEEAVKKLMLKQGAEISNCDIKVNEAENQQVLQISYKKPFEFNESICSADEGPECWLSQMGQYEGIASGYCSDFINFRYPDNHFIYQPQNTLDKIVYVRHINGQDAAPWDPSTITLLDTK